MSDCPNVEMRELLPERVADLLSARDAGRVDAHVAGCADCAFEMTVLRAARAVLRGGRVIDVSRITVAVVSATRSKPTIALASRRRSWTGWRAAASIAVIAVGATSVAVWNAASSGSNTSGPTVRGAETTMVARNGDSAQGTGGTVVRQPNGTGHVPASALPGVVVPAAAAGLSVAGGLSDLSDTELQTLLGDIGSLDPASLSEPDDVMPAFGGAETIQ